MAFAPVSDEKTVINFMKIVGFGKFMPFLLNPPALNIGHRLMFFKDSCLLKKKGKILQCAVNEKGDAEGYISYRISPHLIIYPLSVVNSDC